MEENKMIHAWIMMAQIFSQIGSYYDSFCQFGGSSHPIQRTQKESILSIYRKMSRPRKQNCEGYVK